MPEECFFAKETLEFMGFVFADKSMMPDQEFVNLLDEMPAPRKLEEARLLTDVLFCFKFAVFLFNEFCQPLRFYFSHLRLVVVLFERICV